MVITIIVLCVRYNFISSNGESLSSHVLYKSDEVPHYNDNLIFDKNTTLPSIKGLPHNNLLDDLYDIRQEIVDQNTLKYKYYKLLKVCIPNLRRGLKK
jgi:hypothetical protein